MAINNSINNTAYSFGTTAGLTAGNTFTVTTGTITLTTIAGTNGGVMTSTTAGIVGHIENPTTNGQLLISKSDGTDPIWASLSAGSGISITPGANSISIAATGGGITISEVTADVTPMTINTGYITNKAATACALTLPTTAAVGTVLKIIGKGATGWTVVQASGQSVILGSVATTTGAGGSISSSNTGDCVEIVCIVADTTFRVVSSVGNLTLA